MDADAARLLNIVLAVGGLIGFSVALWFAARPESGYRAAFDWAERSGLPLETGEVRVRVATRLRAGRIADCIAAIIALLVAAVFLPTAIGGSFLWIILIVFPSALLTTLTAATIVQLRDRLFSPAIGSPRVARARTTRTADYLGPFRRGLTWAMAALAAAMAGVVTVTWVNEPTQVNGPLATAGIVISALALLSCALLARLEQAILARPQPASSPLELAWDDAMRSGALATVRNAVATICVVGFAAGVGALWGGANWVFPTSQIVLWSQFALQWVYPPRGFRLRTGLRPRATTAGSVST